MSHVRLQTDSTRLHHIYCTHGKTLLVMNNVGIKELIEKGKAFDMFSQS